MLNFIRGSHDNAERDRNMNGVRDAKHILDSSYSIRDCRDSFFLFSSSLLFRLVYCVSCVVVAVSCELCGWCALIEAAGGA